jgi:hypothetical protein
MGADLEGFIKFCLKKSAKARQESTKEEVRAKFTYEYLRFK